MAEGAAVRHPLAPVHAELRGGWSEGPSELDGDQRLSRLTSEVVGGRRAFAGRRAIRGIRRARHPENRRRNFGMKRPEGFARKLCLMETARARAPS